MLFFTYVCFFGYSFLSLSYSCIFCCCIDLRRIKLNILLVDLVKSHAVVTARALLTIIIINSGASRLKSTTGVAIVLYQQVGSDVNRSRFSTA